MKMMNNIKRHIGETITIKWGISRGRDTYGYTTSNLYNQNNKRISSCNGGGYDLLGTVVGNWISSTFPKELCKLKKEFYGLRFYDPKYDPLDAVLEKCDDIFTAHNDVGKTFRQIQSEGKVVDLDIIRACYRASSEIATKRHTVPSIDGACGFSSVLKIFHAIGLTLRKLHGGRKSKTEIYLIEKWEEKS